MYLINITRSSFFHYNTEYVYILYTRGVLPKQSISCEYMFSFGYQFCVGVRQSNLLISFLYLGYTLFNNIVCII